MPTIEIGCGQITWSRDTPEDQVLAEIVSGCGRGGMWVGGAFEQIDDGIRSQRAGEDETLPLIATEILE